MRKIRVVHIVSGPLSGGAAKGALWLHQAQQEVRGSLVSSILISNDHPTDTSRRIVGLYRKMMLGKFFSRLRFLLEKILLMLVRERRKELFSTGVFGSKSLLLHPEIRKADIVHLHWVNGLLAYRSLKRLEKPIVWTFRDMWPITGGCHYSLDCRGFEKGCGACPLLKWKIEKDISSLVHRSKVKHAPPSLRIVVISEWLKKQVVVSPIYKSAVDPVVIPNIISNTMISPLSAIQRASRRRIFKSRPIILAGSINLDHKYKGPSYLAEIFKELDNVDFTLHTFGRISSRLKSSLPKSAIHHGPIVNPDQLRQLYLEAYIYITTATAEAFGKTTAEAQLNGIPSIAFRDTGADDIIEDERTGFLVTSGDSLEFASRIRDMCTMSRDEYLEFSDTAAKLSSAKFSSKTILKNYEDVYKDALAQRQMR